MTQKELIPPKTKHPNNKPPLPQGRWPQNHQKRQRNNFIAAKALFLKRIKPETEKILKKNQNDFRKNRSITSQILTIHQIIENIRAMNLEETLLFVDFSQTFDSMVRERMGQILLIFGLPKESVTVLMFLYRNTKAMVRSPDGNWDFLNIVAGVLQGDTLETYLFIICLDYVLRTSIGLVKNGFTLKHKKQRISYRNYNRCRQRIWSSASWKYINPS